MSDNDDNPDIKWALDLLTPDPDYRQNWIASRTQEILCGATGFLSPVVRNFWNNKPLLAGFQAHIIMTVLGVGIGNWLNRREKRNLAYRDEILRDYIRRHPEDFVEIKPKLLRDLFLPWVPTR